MKAIDLFAGLGGMTLGAKRAGVHVRWAANHWRIACDTHERNHPEIVPVCQDLQQANWLEAPQHDLLLASPACQGHSPARGKDQPHHDETRATAWAVVDCAEVHRSSFCVVENVPAFTDWVLFPAWRYAMERLGYSLSLNILDAADFGVPQHRVRLIIICTRSRSPFVLCPRRARALIPISRHIQWDCDGWRRIDRTLVPNTRRRIANGRRDFGDRFVMPYYSKGSGLTGRSIDRPIGTITTRDRWAIVDGNRMRMFNVHECRAAMGFPASYYLPPQSRVAKHLLGNAVPPKMITGVLNELQARA